MSAPGFTPISLYYSTTAAAAPSAGNLANGELAVNITDGKLFYKDNGGVVRVLATAAGSAGDVVGPGSSTDNALVRFDGTTGKLVQSSVGVLSDAGALSGLTSVAATTFTGALTGNASTATTLQTSRTIWGQSFDGSANVTGALTGVTDLTASGSMTLSGGTANGVAYLNGSKVLTSGSALTFDGTKLSLPTVLAIKGAQNSNLARIAMTRTDQSWSINNETDLRFYGQNTDTETPSSIAHSMGNTGIFVWNNASTAAEQMRLTSTGLGIGTSSPTAKLDVRGNAVFTGNGTSRQTADFTNTGGQLYVGAESSSGGAVFVGSSAYAGIIGTNTNTPLQLGTNGTIKATLDASGNLLVGTTASTYSYQAKNIVVADGSTAGISLTNLSQILTLTAGYGAGYVGTKSNHPLVFTTNDVERARIDSSGRLLVGTTVAPFGSAPGAALIKESTGGRLQTGASVTTSSNAAEFYNPNGLVGTINTNGGITTYNSLSDYRLKTVLGLVSDAGARIDALEPVEYEWKTGGSRTRGFLAHKFQEVYAGSVTGSKDAVDAEGKPAYQAMQASSSEVIADLVAEIQSLRQRLAAAGI